MNTLPVALQVYGIRDILEQNPEKFSEVMAQVKAIGYDGVELAGLYGLDPVFVRETLQRIGLVPVGAHVPLDELMDDIEKIIAVYKLIGTRYLVVPYLPEKYRPQNPGYEKAISELTRIGNLVADHDMTLLYHNHDFEFVVLPDKTFGLDDIYARVPPRALEAELDTCWIKVAEQDPAAYLGKYQGRCPVVHLKDYIKEGRPKNLYQLIGIDREAAGEDSGIFEFRSVGFGQQIWEPILTAALEADAKWAVVEQDEHYGLPSLECARRSRAYLRILGW